MANYTNLKNIIDQVVRTNGQGEITGANLNQTLQAMVTSLGANYQYAGVATPSTNPGSPDQNVFYVATLAGTYANFSGVTVPKGISVLRWNGTWSLSTLYTVDTGLTPNSDALVQSGTVFEKFKFDGGSYDVSAHFPTGGVNGGPTYTFDSAVTKIPQELRRSGVSFKYIDSETYKYVEFLFLLSTFDNSKFTNPYYWQKYSCVGLAGVTQFDIKGCLGFVPGNLNNNNGYDFNGPWRIRSSVFKLPFDIVVKHNKGFGFRVFYFDNENLDNPQPQVWKDNTAIEQTFEIPANQYFRIVAYWDGHQSQTYAINDVVTSTLYNNIFVYNKTLYNKNNTQLMAIGSTDRDAKFLLNLEPGGIDNNTGGNYDQQPWRIRSTNPQKFPFPITITHHIGFGFRVYYYDGPDMTTAICTPQEWKNNAAVVESFTVPAEQYFRIVAYWDNHQSSEYSVVDLLGSELFYGLEITNPKNKTYDYSFDSIIPSWDYLSATGLPYPNIDTANGLFQIPKGFVIKYGSGNAFYETANEVSVPIETSGTSALKLVFNFVTQTFSFKGFTYLTNESEYILGTIRITTKKIGSEYFFSNLKSANLQFPITIDGLEFNKGDFSLFRSYLNLPILIAAHQGFSITASYYGNSRLSSFKAAGKLGFNIGETDIKWSLDDIPVCCHDASFVDSVTGDTIIIADHTFAELETYNYYGEKIASFDEVVNTCKIYGMNIIVDHLYSAYTDAKLETIVNILKKYAMIEKCLFFVDKNSIDYVNKLKAYYSHIKFLVTTMSLTDDDINFANSIATDYNLVYLTPYYQNNTPSLLVQNVHKLAGGVSFGIWTIDDIDIFKTYLPYVSILLTNKIKPSDITHFLSLS